MDPKKIISDSLLKIKTITTKIFYDSSLKAKTARGGIWLGIGTATEQGSRFIRNIILTRILVPEAFGVMAIVLAVNSIFEGFTQIGIGQSIIQNPNSESKKYLNGAWWFSFIRGSLIFIISFIAAPYIADFYNNPQLTNFLRVAFISMFFNGLISCNLFIAQKQMNFKKVVIINQIGSLSGIILSIILAIIINNVWALVIGFALESVVRCLLSYIICPFFPGIDFEKKHLSSLLKYSRGMFGLPILTLIFMQGDVFVIGKMLPMSELGLYSMAIILARSPFRAINNIISQLLSPIFSKFQNENKKVNNLILLLTTIFLLLGVPLIITCILFSQEILTFVYGQSYRSVYIPFSIIFISEIIKLIGLPFAIFYLMSGKPHLHRIFTGIRAILLVSLIYFGIKLFNLNGASIVVLISITISFIVQLKLINRITSFNISDFIKILLQSILYSLPVFILYFPAYFIFGAESVTAIIMGIAGCIISLFFGLTTLLKKINNKGVI